MDADQAIVAEGVFLASRDLDIDALPTQPLELTRRAYEIRGRTRPTPQSVFAGVVLARAGDEPARLRLSGRHRARTNPSGAWLAALAELLLSDPSEMASLSAGRGDDTVLAHLTLTTSDTATRRGDHWQSDHAGTGETGLGIVDATAATELIMDTCRTGAPVGKVVAEATARWPQATDDLVIGAISTLIRHGFLGTDLLPADLADDPLHHLLSVAPDDHPVRPALVTLRQILADADAHPAGAPERLRLLREARISADAVCWVKRPLTVDVAADAEITLPAGLGREAADAVAVLWRISSRSTAADTYHQRFMRRYGPHRVVPFLEATDPVIGLGTDIPLSANASGNAEDSRASNHSDTLHALIQRASRNQLREVVLDDQTIEVLARPDTPQRPPRTAEVLARVLANSTHDLQHGKFRIALSPGGTQTAGSTLGRFASLLSLQSHQIDASDDDALIAEIVSRPRTPSGATLHPPTGFAARRIPIDVPPEPGDLPLHDLLLVSDGSRMMVWSASEDRQVIPVAYSRLTSRLLAPQAQLLHLLGHAGTRPWQSWSWGTADEYPFQPRIRYQRAILAPARWRIPAELIAAARGPAARDSSAWDAQFAAWQAATVPRLPRIVVTDDGDRCLPLDLRNPIERALLRRYIRSGLRAVTELPGGEDAIQSVATGPSGHHLLEVVIPLARRVDSAHHAVQAQRTSLTRPRSFPVRAFGQGLYLPGSEWLSFAIPAPPDCHDQLVAGLAAVAADHPGSWDSWFWLRYHTPELGPHLRIRFHGVPAALGGQLLPVLSAWARSAARRGLSSGLFLEPYDQEIERYGGITCIQHAENVFAIDSRLTLPLLVVDRDARVMAGARGAALIATILTPSDRPRLDNAHLTPETRERRARLRALVRARHAQDQAPLAGIDSAATPLATSGALVDALVAYAHTLPADQRAGCASSVIHMHANRVLATTKDEPLMRALAADLLAHPAGWRST